MKGRVAEVGRGGYLFVAMGGRLEGYVLFVFDRWLVASDGRGGVENCGRRSDEELRVF
jgi:hypothetical protein